jgi:hypothetical protein
MRRHNPLRSTPSTVRLGAVLTGLALFAGACSSGGADGSRPAAQAGSTSETTGPAGDSRLTPLSAFFTEGQEKDTGDQEASDNDFRRQEQLIAECMTEQGFQYIPRDPNALRATKVKGSEAFDLPPDQYAERWGYGISTIDSSQFEAEVPDDPNSAIVTALSPAARGAYDKALIGIDTTNHSDPITMSHGPGDSAVGRPYGSSLDSPPPDSCQNRALRAVYGEDYAAREREPAPEFDALNEEMGALWDRVVADVRVAEAKQAWADCMAEAGHPEVTDPDSATQTVIERFSALYGVDAREFKMARAGGKDTPMQPDAAALAELQAYERSLAVADHRCKVDYAKVVFEVQSDIEQRFVDEHRAELERYRDSMGLQGGGLRKGIATRGGKG